MLALVLSPLILLTVCLAVELFFGIKALPRTELKPVRQATAVILVPAHNEAAILVPRLIALQAAASPGSTEILVIADNCTDTTADVARAAGVRVIERHEPQRRGKGFALDFGRRALVDDPPDVVLVIDADCITDARSIEHMVSLCLTSARPCQAINLQFAVPDASPPVQISTFAFYIKNVVRQRALQRLAKQVHLLGTGMAFPWHAFSVATLATDEIVEDLTLGLELSELGFRPILIEAAAVWSDPETESNTLVQRRRWEGGFMANALRAGPRMLARSIARKDPGGIWAAIDVMIPPLALLVAADLIALAMSGLFIWATGAAIWPVLVLSVALLAATFGIVIAWGFGGNRFISAKGLAQAPLYVLWKLPFYANLARSRGPKEWLRTRGAGHE